MFTIVRDPVRTTPALWVLVPALLSVCLAASTARGDTKTDAPRSLASYVPGHADVYLEIQSLAELDYLLNRAGVWRHIKNAPQKPKKESGSSGMRAFVRDYFGPQSGISLGEFMQAEVALAAPSWTALTETVCLVRPGDKRAMWRWFPKEKRTLTTRSRGVIYFRSASGMFVCFRDGAMAMTRGTGVSSMLLKHTLPLMQEDGDSLASAPAFRRLRHQLPPNPLAVAYLGTNQAPLPLTSIAALLPDLSQVAAGLYDDVGGLRIDLRGTTDKAAESQPVSPAAIARLLRLPQTTLVANLMRIQANDTPPPEAMPSTLHQYLILLRALRGQRQDPDHPAMPESPHMIVAWDQDLAGKGRTPQVALMIECLDARRLRDDVRHIASVAIRLLHSAEPDHDAQRLEIRRMRHLGVPIEYVPIKEFTKSSKLSWPGAMPDAEPAWAVWGDWLVVAMTRDHLTRIIDAQHGLAPSLDRFREARRLRTYTQPQTQVTVVQGTIAASVLDRWIAAQDAGAQSILDPTLWTPQRSPQPLLDMLGITGLADPVPGMVGVARTTPWGADRLLIGDHIIGLGDRLLDLEAPVDDLASRLSLWTGDTPLRIRVLRDGQLHDVDFSDVQPMAALDIDPVRGAREAAQILRAVQLGTYSVFDAGDGGYNSRLTLRFAKPQ